VGPLPTLGRSMSISKRQFLALVTESDRKSGGVWYPGESLRRINRERFGIRLSQHGGNFTVHFHRTGFRRRGRANVHQSNPEAKGPFRSDRKILK